MSADSDVWSFRNAAYPIVFNTSGDIVYYIYRGIAEDVPGYTCKVCGPTDTWATIATGYLRGDTGGKGGMAVFNFPTGFNYDDRYDIFVVPEYAPWNDIAAPPTPLDINVTGNFDFNGQMDISGDDADPIIRNNSPKARCGGHRGSRKEPIPATATTEILMGYYVQPAPVEYENRFGLQQGHYYYKPTAINGVNPAYPSGYDVFGLGSPLTPPYKVGGGGGYGGIGGDSGRGYHQGIFASGASYGDKEVPVPFGGSAGSWGQMAPGNAGGGGFEIDATGSVTFGPNAKILAKGGTTPYVCQYPRRRRRRLC